jgi:hypothetical protein
MNEDSTGARPSSFFLFSLLIIIPPLLHTPLSPPPEMWDIPEQAAHYHILGLQVRGFISEPALGCLQSKDVAVMHLRFFAIANDK